MVVEGARGLCVSLRCWIENLDGLGAWTVGVKWLGSPLPWCGKAGSWHEAGNWEEEDLACAWSMGV